MAASYEAAATALLVHCENVANAVETLTGKRPDVVGLPDPTLGHHAVWLELPEASRKAGVGLDGRDDNSTPISVGVSVPYDVQRDDSLTAWKIADILNREFPDEMRDDAVLRHTRTGGISLERVKAGGNGPVMIVARCRLNVLISTF